MGESIHVAQGASLTRRYYSELDGAPFPQTEHAGYPDSVDRTLIFTLWAKWARPGQAIALSIVSPQSAPDSRLVSIEDPLDEDDLNVGRWELRLGASDTIGLEPGMYKYTVWSVAADDDEDALVLEPLTNFFVVAGGK